MRLTISLLVALTLSIFGLGLPNLRSAGWVAVASAAPARGATHAVQGRKKKRSRPKKAKAAKKPDKPKKNDRGFEL